MPIAPKNWMLPGQMLAPDVSDLAMTPEQIRVMADLSQVQPQTMPPAPTQAEHPAFVSPLDQFAEAYPGLAAYPKRVVTGQVAKEGLMETSDRLNAMISAETPEEKTAAYEGAFDIAGPGGIATPLFHAVTAFHASPHKFEEFDLGKIGTGEGAQVRGWGLYFADKKGVADWYYDNFSRDLPRKVLPSDDYSRYTNIMSRYGADRDLKGEIEMLDDMIRNFKINKLSKDDARMRVPTEAQSLFDKVWDGYDEIDIVLDRLESDAQRAAELGNTLTARTLEDHYQFISGVKDRVDKPAMYKVDLKPDEDQWLVLDDLLNEQPEKVQKALNEIGISTKVDKNTDPIKLLGGEPVIKPASDYIGDGDTFEYLADMAALDAKTDPAVVAETWGFGPEDEIIRFPGGLNAVRYENDPRRYTFLAEGAEDFTGSWDEFLDAAVEMAMDYGAVDDMAVNFGTGEGLYTDLVIKLGSPKAASKFLNKHGIPGLKFLDQSSRQLPVYGLDWGKPKTYNYVLFDDKLASITERDGSPVINQELRKLGDDMRTAIESGDIEAVTKLKELFDNLVQK